MKFASRLFSVLAILGLMIVGCSTEKDNNIINPGTDPPDGSYHIMKIKNTCDTNVTVYLDGNCEGNIPSNLTSQYLVESGEHKIMLKGSNGDISSCEVDICEDCVLTTCDGLMLVERP